MLLRLTQHTIAADRYRVEVALDEDGRPRQTATNEFDLPLTPQDQERLRWYLEDFLQVPYDPAPAIAERAEDHLEEVGEQLFEAVFRSSDDGRDLWARLRPRLDETRIEVATEVEEATLMPWELMRDPTTDRPLALRADAFVRTLSQPAQPPDTPQVEDADALRILLVICRPGRDDDVPFRSVASRLVRSLSEEARAHFRLDVLRPPTFERLGEVLRRAHDDGAPYHVVHFDGHGGYLDVAELFDAWEDTSDEEMEALLAEAANVDPERYSPQTVYPHGRRAGKHGYLSFENPDNDHNLRLVGGTELGNLLVEAGSPALVLNACRSAHAEAPDEPEEADTQEAADRHAQVRAYGSLAQEVMDTGVPGVVAMRYNVYVDTAAHFVADLYAALVRGQPLGAGVTEGRRKLHEDPIRKVGTGARPLQDWCVPVVYEAAPISLVPEPDDPEGLAVELDEEGAVPQRGTLDDDLPAPPDAGFYGRDDTLLALDRAFDTQSVVLLHAYAGSGKTATAAEFARWYALTGGVDGPVLFTSFEQHTPLPRVLDKIGQAFGPALQDVNWLALDDDERRDVALQILDQVPVLWIWDNVEPVTGFPPGTDSAWTEAEQEELADFLREARETQAKFLLTSRREERDWLGTLPRRIAVPPMPMLERTQLAGALAERHGHAPTDVEDWRPLLRFTQGNPLTITVLVGQALRDGRTTRDEIDEFVDELRAGEADVDDAAERDRTRSLDASLRYGFENAFTEDERRTLALLHFFQGVVDVDALVMMGNPDADWSLPAVRGLSREEGIALLDCAAEVGLLSPRGEGVYDIHPALPWFFRRLFDRYHADAEEEAARAFVEAVGGLGDYYHDQYERGNRDVIAALRAEEANLLHARRLARTYEWWDGVISTMQGLNQLYDHTGRRAEWKRLVEEIVPDFVDPETDGPRPGREEWWSIVTNYRIQLAMEARQWAEAERLQRRSVERQRREVTSSLDVEPEALSDAIPETLEDSQRNPIRSLLVSLHVLGQILRKTGEPGCVDAYQESLNLAEQIGERAGAAKCAFNLGHAYKDLSELRDLEEAEDWYRHSLELRKEDDRQGRAQCLGQLGSVAHERFEEALDADKPHEELLDHLNEAAGLYHAALELLPANAVNDLAVTHNALGVIYRDAGDLDRALPHYRKAIRYDERADNVYGAAQTRFNVARALVRAGRPEDALDYARAALRDYQTYGEQAAEMIQRTEALIEDIEQHLDNQED